MAVIELIREDMESLMFDFGAEIDDGVESKGTIFGENMEVQLADHTIAIKVFSAGNKIFALENGVYRIEKFSTKSKLYWQR